MESVEVPSGPERRRRWGIEQKQAIVAAAFEPGAGVRDVARQADVHLPSHGAPKPTITRVAIH
jgi:transposase